VNGRRNEHDTALPFLHTGGRTAHQATQAPYEIIAGITLAALAIPEVMGYTKIAGTPLITGLYTILIPMALFAIFGSSRHLGCGAGERCHRAAR
jgi:sulfate permease, SulP family